MRVIDFHNHYYPPQYMQALQSGESSVTSRPTQTATRCCITRATTTSRSAATAISRIDATCSMQHGVAMQVVTLTTPGTHVERPATAVRLAAMVNDEFSEAMAQYPRRHSPRWRPFR